MGVATGAVRRRPDERGRDRAHGRGGRGRARRAPAIGVVFRGSGARRGGVVLCAERRERALVLVRGGGHAYALPVPPPLVRRARAALAGRRGGRAAGRRGGARRRRPARRARVRAAAPLVADERKARARPRAGCRARPLDRSALLASASRGPQRRRRRGGGRSDGGLHWGLEIGTGLRSMMMMMRIAHQLAPRPCHYIVQRNELGGAVIAQLCFRVTTPPDVTWLFRRNFIPRAM